MSTEQPKAMPTPQEAIALGAQVTEGAQAPMSEREQRMLDTGPLLEGERQTGFVPRPDGTGAVHELTADGMKQVRNVGSPYARPVAPKSAAHFHYDGGVATPEEVVRVEAERGINQPQKGRLARIAGKLGLH